VPELPEAEVVRRGVDRAARGRTVTALLLGRDRATRRDPDPASLPALVTGRRVESVDRVGKVLVVDLWAGPGARPDGVERDVLVVHLGMSGQLRTARTGDDRPAHTHVVWVLDDGTELRFVDPRTFGHVARSTAPPGGRPAALAHLGPDALDELDPAALAAAFAGRRVAVKARLLDQTAVAGLGNIYADEVLFRAGISPLRAAGSVRTVEVDRLAAAIPEVLTAAIAAGGSTLGDGGYVDVDGRTGRYQAEHRVHARAGQACPDCAAPITRVRLGGRTASWCPRCQR